MPIIPGYVLADVLGRGGMGVVYRATQIRLQRPVALKMIATGQLASEDEVRRFRAEAEAASQLDHPGIVPIFEAGEHEGQHYFAMGLVEGGSLAERVKEGPLPPAEAAALVRQIALALAYAHKRGIIHRDLKPANILLQRKSEILDPTAHGGDSVSNIGFRSSDFVPKVTDFGLAKRLHRDSQLTGTGQIMGTPSYMAPEQAAGRTREVDTRADLYALGAILYCLLTGRPPFQAASAMDTLRQVIDKEPVAPRQLNSAVSRDLETVCLKCLRKEPDRRYASADELAEDLRRFLDGEPVRARPAGRSERLWRWCRRNPVLAATAGTAGLATLAAVVILAVMLVLVSDARDDQAQARKDAEEQKAEADRRADTERELRKQEHELRKQAQWHVANLSFQQAYTRSQQQGEVHGLLALAAALEKAFQAEAPDLDESVRLHLTGAARSIHKLRAVLPHQGAFRAIAFSPDGKLLVTGSDKTIRVWNTATGQPAGPPLQTRGLAEHLSFLPGGKSVRVYAGGWAQTWDSETGKLLGESRAPSVPPNRLMARSSDGGRVVVRGGPREAVLQNAVMDEAGGKPLTHQDEIWYAHFSTDSRIVVTSGKDGLRLWDAATGQALGQPVTRAISATASFSDGNKLRIVAVDSTILWDLKEKKSVGTGPGLPMGIPSAISPNGEYFSPGDWIYDVRTGQRFGSRLLGFPVAFSPDGKLFATGGEDGVRLWELATGEQPPPSVGLPDARNLRPLDRVTWNALGLPDDDKTIRSAFKSVDGKRALVINQNGTVRLWDVPARQSTDLASLPQGKPPEVYLSRDGKTLLTVRGSDVRRWDASTGKVIEPPLKANSSPDVVTFSPDGQTVVLVYGFTRTVCLWPAGAEQAVTLPWKMSNSLGALTFSPDGKTLVTAGNPEVGLWDVATAKPVGRPLACGERPPLGVGFSADGKVIWALAVTETGGGLLRLWEATTGKHTGPALTIERGLSIGSQFVAVSPDGKLAVLPTHEGCRIWDTKTRRPVGPPLRAANGNAAFSPDGKTILLGSGLWETTTGKQIGAPFRFQVGWKAGFGPDGKTVLVGDIWNDNDERLWQWPIAPLGGTPEQILLWSQVITGMEMDEYGAARMLDAGTWQERRRKLEELGEATAAKQNPPRPGR
jgi:WD40 repeat protein/tRNA A-37 threonylcarbamoyl transferase component Bud32